ncbi:MAG: adenylyltransferase/cytidyltransferase family protein [Caldilineales bacterium]|nr:adenylyltransferase/cytidyltransferase family protein [Caldilineales bacterium]
MKQVIVSGSFDDIRSRHMRFLQAAGEHGPVHVLLWSDATIENLTGKAPKFDERERLYLLESIRYVDQVTVADAIDADSLPELDGMSQAVWVVVEGEDSEAKRAYCRQHGLGYVVLTAPDLAGFPLPPVDGTNSGRKKVVVTGCYDWFHSGHVRFFEETSALGDLYVVVGNDANLALLKGEGHPLFPEDERRFMVQSIRFVTQALISSGSGWMDAAPEIARLRPDIYAVNEDGDVAEKREFCEANGLNYVVLKRLPKEGLTRRQSTDLRGF